MELQFLLDQAHSLKRDLDKFRPMESETESRIFQKLRLDWNYHSNHLEGGQLTYGETKALILFGITAQGKPLQDHLETSGHDEAILWIEDVVKGDIPLTESFIRQLHEIILKKPYKKNAITPDGKKTQKTINVGVYKTTPNHVQTVTGEIFRFATPEETPAKMEELIAWYREKKEEPSIHPIVFAAEFHYRFILIHPFDDGNGRLARLLMNFILMQFGYPPAIIRTDDKENYFSALRQADAGILEPFVAYISENVIKSLELMLKGAKGERIEDPDDVDKAITLLEYKLKSFGDKIVEIKSEKTLIHFLEKFFPLIVLDFIELNEKFEGFYVSKDYLITRYEWVEQYDDSGQPYFDEDGDIMTILAERQVKVNSERFELTAMSEFKNAIFIYTYQDVDECFFKIACHYHIFNRSGIAPFDYVLKIKIVFEKTNYHIIGEDSGKRISKLYHQEPSKEELDYVFQAEARMHLQAIQKAIGE